MATGNLTRFTLFAMSFLGVWTITDLLTVCNADDLNDETGFRFELLDQGTREQSAKTGTRRFPRIVADNGMFHFVLKDAAQELVQLLEDGGLGLSDAHREAIHDKIDSIYERSKDHPALESDLVAFSPQQPDYHQYTPDSVLRTRVQERRDKRDYPGEIHEVCQSEESWASLPTANLRNHTRVRVLPGLQFHMKQCTWLSEGSSCIGISPRFGVTSCQTKGTWVRALVCGGCNFSADPDCSQRCPNVRDLYHWEWIYTPTCCRCAYSLFQK